MGTIIGYVVVGLVAGAVAKFLGGALFGIHDDTIFSFQGLITAVAGALVVLVVYGLIRRRTA